MNPSQKTNLFESEKTIWAVLALVLVIWSYFSYTNWISDSEFWPVTLSGHWDQWKLQPALIFKPLFHLSLSWIYAFNLNSVEHLKVAKAFYTLLGATSFVVFFQILKKYLSSQKALCVVLIFLFTNLGFSQIGTIRSDFLSYFGVLFFFLLEPKVKRDSWVQHSLLVLVFSVLLVLITPKSLFLALLISVYSFFKLKGHARVRFVLATGWLFIFAYFLADYLIAKFGAGRGVIATLNFAGSSYFSKDAMPFFSHILNYYLISDAVIWLGIFIGLCWQVIQRFNAKNRLANLSWLMMGVLGLLILLLHKPALPFFVGSYLGLFILSVVPFLQKISVKYLLSVLVVTLVMFMVRYQYNYHYPNAVQLSTIQKLEDLLAEIPNGKMFDGLAVAPRAPQDLFYLGPDEDQSNSQILTLVKSDKPELIVYTHRLKFIEPEIGELLRANYEPIGIGYWLRKDIKVKTNLSELKPAFFIFGYYPAVKF